MATTANVTAPQPSWPPDQSPPMGHNAAPRTIMDMMSEWYEAKAALAAAQAKEVELRKQIFDQAFPNAPEKGSVRLDVGYGKSLKGTAKLNYTVDREGLANAIKDGLDQDVLDKVIRYKPEVSETGLFSIEDPATKAKLAAFITSKPGLPSLEITDAPKRGK